MKYIISLVIIIVSTTLFAQTNNEKLSDLQKKLDEINISLGNEDDVDFRKISENIKLLVKTLKQKDSLNLQISILNSELLLANARLKNCILNDSIASQSNTNPSKVINILSYENDNFSISDNEKQKLDLVVATFKKGGESKKIFIIGHTDSVGSSAYNMKLSKKRASTVWNYICSKGINSNLVIVDYRGETDSLNTVDSKKNRRVEVYIL